MMRMWIVNPSAMCRNHLLGEHLEIHMFVGAILNGQLESGRLKGFINNGLLEVDKLKSRHELLVKEMARRGYKHKSPLPKFKSSKIGIVDIENNYKVLSARCEKCRKRISKCQQYKYQR